MRVGGTVCNTLKGGGTEKRGGDTKILKRGEASWAKGGALKRSGGWNPLTNYVYYQGLEITTKFALQICIANSFQKIITQNNCSKLTVMGSISTCWNIVCIY